MATFELKMWDDSSAEKIESIEAESVEEARGIAESEATDWAEDGDWGDDGACVRVHWSLEDENGDEVWDDYTDVEIEPNHENLIRAAGGDPDCNHDWTSEGEGGLDENPGVWGLGGTAIKYRSHCRKCGLIRTEISLGSQRNPGEHDTVEYQQPS